MFFTIILNCLAFIVAVGVLISVHEFGHFYVARLCNVKVESFSVGFGKTLFNFYDRHGTKYIIAAIPLGGYVKMLNENVDDVPISLKHQAFNNKTILQRMAIILAGPVANFIFAFVICWIIFIHGIPGLKPIVNKTIIHSIAYNNHITEGTEIKFINGVKTPDWGSVRMELINNIGNKNTIFTIKPSGKMYYEDKNIDLSTLKIQKNDNDILLNLGILQSNDNMMDITLSAIQPNSPASQAGFKIGDKLIQVNNQILVNWNQFLNTIKNNAGKKILIDVKRDNTIKRLILVPKIKIGTRNEGFVGLSANIVSLPNKYKFLQKYSPLKSIKAAYIKISQLIKMNILILINILTGNIQAQSLSGPISIARMAGISAEYGLFYYLTFLALISVNLGVINLFPLPILDGGQLIFLMIEKIKGSPISLKIQNISYRISSILLIILMIFTIFNDFARLK